MSVSMAHLNGKPPRVQIPNRRLNIDLNESPPEIEEEVQSPGLTPAESYQSKMPIQLQRSAIMEMGSMRAVPELTVRALKGPAGLMTTKLANAHAFPCLVHKPIGEFREQYQILSGGLEKNHRLASHIQYIWFVPAYSWISREVVLYPIKKNSHGKALLAKLEKLEQEFPNDQSYVQWDSQKNRFAVKLMAMSESEKELLAAVAWPTVDEILNTLSEHAFNDLTALSKANSDVRYYLESREID